MAGRGDEHLRNYKGVAMKEQVIYLVKGEDRMGREIMAGACDAVEASNHPATVWAHGRVRPEMLGSGRVSALMGVLSEEVLRQNGCAELPIPVLNLSNRTGSLVGAGNFLSDDREVGRMAARVLLEKGFTRFLVHTYSDITVHRERAEGFEARVREAGLSVERADRADLFFKMPSVDSTDSPPDLQGFYRAYLEELPLGSGIFATSDQLAFGLLHCMWEEFPGHLHTSGVIGVDNDFAERWGGSGIRGVTSIEPDFREMGRQAMSWILDHPGGEGKTAAESQLRRLPPRRVVERASTVCGGCTDPQTARMIRWLWSRIRGDVDFSIEEMARVHGMSLKTLQRRFREHTGGTAKEVVARFRLDLARALMRDSSLTLGEISERCGYSKASAFSRAFEEAEGMSPRRWREG